MFRKKTSFRCDKFSGIHLARSSEGETEGLKNVGCGLTLIVLMWRIG